MKQDSTFYLTSCVFDSCSTQKSTFIDLHTRANTISHICAFNIRGKVGDNNKEQDRTLFLNANTPSSSFLKIIFCTFVGNGEESNYKRAVYMHGNAAFRCQCNNVSYFSHYERNGQDDLNDRSSLDIRNAKCANIIMNTIYKTSTDCALYVHGDTNDANTFSNYVSLLNVIENNFREYLIITQLNNNARLAIEDCYFLKNQKINDYGNIEHLKNFVKNLGGKLSLNKCTIDFQDPLYDNTNGMEIGDIIISTEATPYPLNHFVTDVCLGVNVSTAYGCQNGTCENKGCDPDDFHFKPEDLPYTEKFHPDIDTPTPSPTGYFTESFIFSKSYLFSESENLQNQKTLIPHQSLLLQEALPKQVYFRKPRNSQRLIILHHQSVSVNRIILSHQITLRSQKISPKQVTLQKQQYSL